jgi:hypothetical protein
MCLSLSHSFMLCLLLLCLGMTCRLRNSEWIAFLRKDNYSVKVVMTRVSFSLVSFLLCVICTRITVRHTCRHSMEHDIYRDKRRLNWIFIDHLLLESPSRLILDTSKMSDRASCERRTWFRNDSNFDMSLVGYINNNNTDESETVIQQY